MRQRLQSSQTQFAKIRSLAILTAFTLLPCFSLAVPSSQNKTGETTTAKSEDAFRFHMPTEPPSLDPARLSSNDASYFLHNVMRGLYRYSEDDGLRMEGARSCLFETPLRLRCTLASDVFWSDGQRVRAEDYVRAFRHLVNPASKSLGVELLASLKNAKAIYAGQVPSERLGIRARGQDRLEFEFESRDPDFLYKLASSVLAPIRSEKFPDRNRAQDSFFNGPYRVASWAPGRRIRLESNPRYTRGSTKRPPVEILFVDEDETALSLYEKGTLTFLRRLPTHYIAKYKQRPDFKQIPIARFDYLGFGPDLKELPQLRAALSYSLKFDELAIIYDSLGTPGCFGLPDGLATEKSCLAFDLDEAKANWAQIPEGAKQKRYKLVFSRLGGDDVKKGAEWMQAQWQKHLGLKVDIEAMEQGVYLSQLKSAPPSLFRKGVGLDRPTCLAALETFAKAGSENFIRLDDPAYEKILTELSQKNARPSTRKSSRRSEDEPTRKLCSDGLKYLLERKLLIPMGRIHFTLLAQPRFTGWKLNELNQLDLSTLRLETAQGAKKFQ